MAGLDPASLGLSVGGSILQHSLQKGLMAEQAKYNLAQWNRENAYNHPARQMERFAEAGLNPDLIYGQSNESGSGSAVTETGYASNPLQTYGSVLNANISAEKMGAEIDLLRAQEEEVRTRAGLNTAKAQESFANIERMGILNGLTEEQKVELRKRCDFMDSQMSQIAQSIAESMARTENFDLKNVAQRIENAHLEESLAADIELKLSQAGYNKQLSRESAERVRFAVASFGARLKNLDLDNMTKEQQIELMKKEGIAMNAAVLDGLYAGLQILTDENGNPTIANGEAKVRTLERVADDVFGWLGQILHINLSKFSGLSENTTYRVGTSKSYEVKDGHFTGNGKERRYTL